MKSHNHSAYSLQYHLVLVTKYRKPCITNGMIVELENEIGIQMAQWKCKVASFNGEVDHIHLLFEAHPSLNLSSLIRQIKTNTARKMRAKYKKHLAMFYWKRLFWNRSYAIVSAGKHANLDALIKYIENQNRPLN